MLRELETGDEALLITQPAYGNFTVGRIYTVKRIDHTGCYLREGGYLERKKLLAIGDKVVRGPDWDEEMEPWSGGGEGKVVKFNPEGTVKVEWDEDGNRSSVSRSYIMNANRQDLKPTGDSEGTGEDKPECFGSKDCPKQHTCDCWTECREAIELYNKQKHKPQEDTMTRGKQADTLDKDIIAKRDALKEYVARENEQIVEMEVKVTNLRTHDTDKAENIALVVTAQNLDGNATPEKQAEAMLALKDKGIEV